MKRSFSLLVFLLLSLASSQAVLVLSDSFNYDNGPIVGAAGSPWQSHSGTAETALVTNQQLELSFSSSRSEDVNALLANGPYDTTNNPSVTALYASLKVRFTALPSGSGSYIAHFKDAGTGFRGRLYALTNGTTMGGQFRLGIASTNSASSSQGFVAYPLDLSTGSLYTVVIRLDLTNGAATLWIDPTAESDFSVSSTANPGVPLAILAFAFRQTSGIGNSLVDDLKVGTSFQDVAGANQAPFISGLAHQILAAGQSTGPLPFTVGDAETSADNLTITKSSSDVVLIPESNIVLSGIGSNRTVTVTPAAGQQGVANVTLTVADADGGEASTTFRISVGVPTISAVANQITPTNTVAGPLPFTIADTETDPGALTVTAFSSNQGLVPDSSLSVGGSGANRTLTIAPATDQAGLATIWIVVSDGISSVSNRFVLTVYPLLGLLRTDDFNRGDGPLVQLDGQWLSNGGTGGTNLQQMQIVGGRVCVTEDGSEDVSTELPPGQPTPPTYSTTSGVILYAGFAINVARLPTPSGSYFGHFRDSGTGFRARVFLTRANAAPGHYRMGVANNSASIPSAGEIPLDLATNTTYPVVLRYNVGTGESRLWVDPANESSAGVTATDNPFPVGIEAFTWRQNSGLGVVYVDDLKVGTAFSDVAALRYALSILRSSPTSLEISWPAEAGGHTLQSTSAVPGGWSDHTDQGTVQGDRRVVVINNPSGNLFFRLARP